MKSIYLMFTGLSLSGKTWLFNKIKERFPDRFFPLDTRSIHDYLNQFEIFKDDNSIEGNNYEMRQEATDSIQKSLVTVITKRGYSIAQDSCNRLRKDRKERIELVRQLNPNIKVVLIYVNPSNDVVLKRAKMEDLALKKSNRKEVWVDLYNKQVETYEKPNQDEADYLLTFDGSNLDKILGQLDQILS